MDGPYQNYFMYGPLPNFIYEWSQTKRAKYNLTPKILWIAQNKKKANDALSKKNLWMALKQKVLWIAHNEWPTKKLRMAQN